MAKYFTVHKTHAVLIVMIGANCGMTIIFRGRFNNIYEITIVLQRLVAVKSILNNFHYLYINAEYEND